MDPPRLGRLERRLDLVQVENHPFSRLGRETDACENLFEVVVGPPAANVVGRFPDADDVERILARGAVVAELTECHIGLATCQRVGSPAARSLLVRRFLD